jgi:Holliday junction resolvasome RuvABC endonuclease subunit
VPLRFLGLDPALACIGYALVDCDRGISVLRLGVIETKASSKLQRSVRAVDDNVRRTREVGDTFESLGLLVHADAIMVEAFSHPPNASSAAKIALVFGAVVEMARCRGLALLQATPKEIKKAVTGRSSSSKEAVAAALAIAYGEHLVADLLEGVAESKREHAFDALGAVVACLDTDEVRLLRRR